MLVPFTRRRIRLERVLPLGLAAMFVSWVVAPAALASPRGRRSAATITASFADSCRDFVTHSSKDISHVKIHYVDGRVVKDEHICGHGYAVDGAAGDEIEFAIVKSGRTSEQFDCEATNAAPTALLEIQTPPVDQTFEHCYDFGNALVCEQSNPRTAWTGRAQLPEDGGGGSAHFIWGCRALTDPWCPSTVTFRGTGSTDADGDIASWSLDFGDGTSASGTWSAPPAGVAHEYVRDGDVYRCTGVFNGGNGFCVVTLTVTDTAGQSASSTIPMFFLNQAPD
jgi:hypothetical protein